MSLLNYESALRRFDGQELMCEAIAKMQQFDLFTCLRGANLLEGSAVAKWLPHGVPQYLRWCGVCGGGLLFDTTLLCWTEHDAELDLDFDTLQEHNTPQALAEYGLPAGYTVIAVRSYGDPICLSHTDEQVYLWNCEDGAFETVWASFADFVADETDTAIELIAEGALAPIPFKLAEDEEES